MNGFKKLTIMNVGTFLLLAGIYAFIPTTVCGQGGNTLAKDVNVVNTPTVNVANPVELATGTTVGIDPTKNVIKLDPVSLVSNTVLVVNQPSNVSGGQNVTVTVGPVDVSQFKQIRVVVARDPVGPSVCPVEITPYLRYGNEFSKKIPLDNTYSDNMNQLYETPGQSFELLLRNPPGNCVNMPSVMQVVIYGR